MRWLKNKDKQTCEKKKWRLVLFINIFAGINKPNGQSLFYFNQISISTTT